jgi:hypothetical protein
LILIFVRRDCVAGKIGTECCKHLTVERKKRNRSSGFAIKQGEFAGHRAGRIKWLPDSRRRFGGLKRERRKAAIGELPI